ncbi:MAG: hypothetical protein Q9227_007561 [Pyrenula ochraceoflavens]
MSESVPSSVTSFAHRRSRQDSVASFTYFQEDDESPQWSDEEALAIDEDDENEYLDRSISDVDARSIASAQRKSSDRSRASAEQPLLRRHDSTKSDTRAYGHSGNFSQKLYLVTEDMEIVIAGFQNSLTGLVAYVTICVLTAGLAYLVLRWLPRWRIRLVGSPVPLKESAWVVIEVSPWLSRRYSKSAAKSGQNQWGEFTVHPVSTQTYGHALSTVFGSPGKEAFGTDDDEDPPLEALSYIDYRYMRLFYHPMEDKFVLCNGWKDPAWTEVNLLRSGLDTEGRDQRESIFGKNAINIVQKSIPQLLIDEV